MASKELQAKFENYEEYIKKKGIDEKVIDYYCKASEYAITQEKDIEYGLEKIARAKEIINEWLAKNTRFSDIWAVEKEFYGKQNVELVERYYSLLKNEAFYKLDSFIYYMEKNREPSKRFYLPRKQTLEIVCRDLEDLENRVIKFYGLSMPSRVGKSTICIFFLAWIALKRPNSHSAMGGHSGILAKGFYKELSNLFITEEYTFKELFEYYNPKYAGKKLPTSMSADEFTLTLGDPDRFATITCRGIDGTWTGAVDVSSDGYLYVDDLVRDREHSLSPMRMENTFQEYLNKMVDRKIDGARELMVGTLWNVLDPLARLKEMYANNPLYRFRKIPALNEKDESNFAYEINGFSTEYYRDMRERLDNAEWMAKYQQQPYVREGLLFPSNELQYFNGLLPEDERKIIALCDPAFGGADRLSMPIVADFGDKKRFVIDWVHKSGTQAVTVPLIVDKIIKHYITELHIEQNAGGKLITDSIKAEMQRRDCRHCNIVPYYASTKLPKDEKIKGYSDWVKSNFMFLMPNTDEVANEIIYKRSEQYELAMAELCMYTAEGKNAHDDSADAITQLAIVIGKKKNKARIMASPI